MDDARSDPAHEEAINDLFDLLSRISTHPNVLFELFGAYRHIGHPAVDEIRGIEVLRENSHLELPLKEECLLEVSAAFNRHFYSRVHKEAQKMAQGKDRGS